MQRRKDLPEIQEVLRGEDFRRGQDRRLVAVFHGDHCRLRGDDRLAAADVALQQAVHRRRRGHVAGDLAEHALLRRRGLERQHLLHLLAHPLGELEGDACGGALLAALERHAGLQPEELLEDEPELLRRPELVQQVQVRVLRRKMQRAQRLREARQPQPAPDGCRQRILEAGKVRRQPEQDVAENPRRDLPRRLVDGHDASGMQRRVFFVLLAAQDFQLRMQHHQPAQIRVELHLAEQRRAHAGLEHARQILRVEPPRGERNARAVLEHGLDHAQVAAPEARRLHPAHGGDHRGRLARRKPAERLQVGAVLIAERRVVKQVRRRLDAFGAQLFGALRTDALDVLDGSGQVDGHSVRGLNFQCTQACAAVAQPRRAPLRWP